MCFLLYELCNLKVSDLSGRLEKDNEDGELIRLWFDATKSVGYFQGEGEPKFERVGVWRSWFRSHRCD